MSNHLDEIKRVLDNCTDEQRQAIFQYLRSRIRLHPIEDKLNIRAEVILDAISRAGDLTLRGIRGIIAESSFLYNMVKNLNGWTDKTPEGDHPYDFLLTDGNGDIRVQVKMQRLKSQRPMMANEGYRFLPKDMFVVETQRTRGGSDQRTGEDTRPYKFNEFDILAVSLHPSTGDWSRFVYTVASWLLPSKNNRNLLLKFQPVAMTPNDDWTSDFLTCVSWFRSGRSRTIQPGLPHRRKRRK